MLYLRSGKIIYTWKNGHTELLAGETVYLPQGSRYEAEFVSNDGVLVKDYLINFSLLNETVESVGSNPKKISVDCGKMIALPFKEAVESIIEGTEPFLIKSRFYYLLHLLNSVTKEDDDKFQVYKIAAKMLSECNTMSVEEVAKKLYINRNTFQKKFKTYYGMSPAEYRCNKRIERAKRLLETTDTPVKEIAYSLGFYDVAYFYRVFAEKVGQTPKKYRENGTGNFI